MDTELNFEKRYRLVREVIETLVLIVLMYLIINLAVQNFDIMGPSMEPTLHDTERVMVDKWTYKFREPARGDVIVFIAPPNPTQDFVKRIVALPGDTVTVRGTTVIVNGVTLDETYVKPEFQGDPNHHPRKIENMVVPPDNYFTLGDDRIRSDDSRRWGFVPRKNIIGRVFLIFWPLGQDNNGLLPNPSPVFEKVAEKAHRIPSATLPPALALSEMTFCALPAMLLIAVRLGKRRALKTRSFRPLNRR